MATPEVQWPAVQQVLSGQPSQRVTAAQYVVNIGAVQGGVVNVAPEGRRSADRMRAHRIHPQILPRTIVGFVNRNQELGQLGQALARRQVVDVHGPDGVGKTALISRTMHTQLPSAFPAGTVYLSARHTPREDLLQELFLSFFETRGNVRITENELRRRMAGKRALVAIDDVDDLGDREAESLAQALPQCAMVIGGQRQQVWEGTALRLRGLPAQEAVDLFEQHWGRLPAPERTIAEQICSTLGNIPEAIVKAASAAAQQRLTLGQVLQGLQADSDQGNPIAQAFGLVARGLSVKERRVLGGLASPGGTTVGVEALPDITGMSVEEIGQILVRLQQMDLVQTHSPRYSLDDAFRPHIRRAWSSRGMRARAASYYMQRAHQLQGQPKDLDEENVMLAQDYYFRHRQWQQVVYITRAAEGYLATRGHWGEWKRRLQQAWRAANELGDRASQAWAQNQLGVIALGLGNAAAAGKLFKGALAVWTALGDQAGMTIARWNLQILAAAPPVPPGKGKPPPKPGPGGATLPIMLMGTIAVLLVTLFTILAVTSRRPITYHTSVPPTQPPTFTAPVPSATPVPSRIPTIPPTGPPPCQCGDGYCERDTQCREDGFNCPADCCQCGDGRCERDEPCSESGAGCPQDCCGCGDGLCERGEPCGEDGAGCPDDCCECGDGICDGDCRESHGTCPVDCPGPACDCGDGICNWEDCRENSETCPADCCQCGNGTCEEICGEDRDTCPVDCPGPACDCGDGICNWEDCRENSETCPADCCFCGDKICDADCPENIENCPVDCCQCGNGTCEEICGEDRDTCPADCPGEPCECGDGLCNRDPACNEDGVSCVPDCCECDDGYCDRQYPCDETGYNCMPDCCRCGDGICERDEPCSESGATCLDECCECGDGICEEACNEVADCPDDCLTTLAVCIDFEDVSGEYTGGDTFDASGVTITVGSMGGSGPGYAAIVRQGNAGGSGQEILLAPATIQIYFGQEAKNPSVNLGDYGGGARLKINGEERSFGNLIEMDGQKVGGVELQFVQSSTGPIGTLQIWGRTGPSLVIGGYELFVDDICAKPDTSGFGTLSSP